MASALFSSHDMYLKLDTYFLRPNSRANIKLFNGTFDLSENAIARDRMIDVSLVGADKRIRVDTAQWSEEGGVTILSFQTGEAGTWIAGVSTRPRNIELAAADFNAYLEHDGVLDMLDWRKKNNALDQDAVEKYSKHVKTIFQVGDKLTNDWRTVLGYPVEFIPLSNPYDLHPGHDMQVKLLWQGEPLANQLVYVGSKEKDYEHGHEHADGAEHEHPHEHAGEDGEAATHHHDLARFRTDADGKLTFNVNRPGIWYLRTIYLTRSEEAGLTHESNWATLTFEVGAGHSHPGEDEQSRREEDGLGIPAYAFWAGSLILFLGLYFWFSRKEG